MRELNLTWPKSSRQSLIMTKWFGLFHSISFLSEYLVIVIVACYMQAGASSVYQAKVYKTGHKLFTSYYLFNTDKQNVQYSTFWSSFEVSFCAS